VSDTAITVDSTSTRLEQISRVTFPGRRARLRYVNRGKEVEVSGLRIMFKPDRRDEGSWMVESVSAEYRKIKTNGDTYMLIQRDMVAYEEFDQFSDVIAAAWPTSTIIIKERAS
jgi:hypothetical protein